MFMLLNQDLRTNNYQEACRKYFEIRFADFTVLVVTVRLVFHISVVWLTSLLFQGEIKCLFLELYSV